MRKKTNKTFEANSNPHSPPLEVARAGSGQKLGNCLKQWAAQDSLQAVSPTPEHRDCCGQGWDTGEGIKTEHRLAEEAVRAPELVLLPTKEHTVWARVRTIVEQQNPVLPALTKAAGWACSLLLHPGKTLNHTKSNTEIHTQRQI